MELTIAVAPQLFAKILHESLGEFKCDFRNRLAGSFK